MTVPEARAELQRVAGTQLDPRLVEVIAKLLDNGTLVSRRDGHAPAAEQPVTPPAEVRKAV